MKKRLTILFSILLLTGCSIKRDLYKLPKDAIINIDNKSIEVYKTENLYSLITDTNMEVINEDIELDSSTIGEHTYTLDLKYNKKRYKYDIKYTVIDTEAPRFISAPSSKTTLLTNVIDPCESIIYGDNYDIKPTCSIEKNVDYTKEGSYKVKYVLKDSSGNETTKDLIINVVSSYTSKKNEPAPVTYTYIEDVISEHKNSNTSIGIDVSRWQGNVDWNLVKDSGIEFVIMRIGVQSDPEETLDMDSKFLSYIKAAKDVGLKVGVYVYNTSINKDMGIKTAQFVINTLNGEKLDYPIAYDWENWNKFMNYNISLHTLKEGYNGFKETLEKAGYSAMLYSSKYYLENAWLDIEDDTIWLAHYTNKTNYNKPYYIWQMCSDGKIPGITENTVDIDILYK